MISGDAIFSVLLTLHGTGAGHGLGGGTAHWGLAPGNDVGIGRGDWPDQIDPECLEDYATTYSDDLSRLKKSSQMNVIGIWANIRDGSSRAKRVWRAEPLMPGQGTVDVEGPEGGEGGVGHEEEVAGSGEDVALRRERCGLVDLWGDRGDRKAHRLPSPHRWCAFFWGGGEGTQGLNLRKQ